LLDNESGACCNYATLYAAAAARLSPEEIADATSKKPCRFPDYHCTRRGEGRCSIAAADVRTNLAVLKIKGAAESDEVGRWAALA
jgi:hypothetical protein